MYDSCPTVKIKAPARPNGKGYRIINASAFDPAAHERFDESPTVASSLSTDDKGAVPGGSDSAPCLHDAELTVLELRAALKLAGVAMPHGALKADLVALYEASQCP